MSNAAPYMEAASAATQAVGAYYQAVGKKIQLRLAANLATINAERKDEQARDALRAGERQSQGVMLQTAQTKSTQRAALAANGVALDSDSAVNLLTTTDYLGAVDRQTVETNAIKSAWGIRTDAVNLRNEAALDLAQRKMIHPTQSATQSLLGNSGEVSDAWYRASQRTDTGGTAGKSGKGGIDVSSIMKIFGGGK